MRFRSRVSVGFAVAAAGLAAAAVLVPVSYNGSGGAAAAATTAASTAAATVPYAPYPATGNELYVDNAVNSNCSDSGAGSQAQPFCTITAAVSAALPVATPGGVQPPLPVVVEPGTYAGATITTGATADAPTTLTAIQGASISGTLTLDGAHNVVLNGFSFNQGIDVSGGSSGITINGGIASPNNGSPAIEVDGTSSDVTISRMAIGSQAQVGQGNSIQVDSGASGVVITGNTIDPDVLGAFGVLVTDAPGTDVTGNTIRTDCSGGISIAGTSPSATVENNIVDPEPLPRDATCSAGLAISVSAGSEAGSVVDYNLVDYVEPLAAPLAPLYDWGGTSYTSLADFQAASRQGTHDIVADPGLSLKQTAGPDQHLAASPGVFWYQLSGTSPAIDSANANAPGELTTDQFGNPRADDPSVANDPSGDFDRGAVELEGDLSFMNPPGTVARSGPLSATFTVLATPNWASNGPLLISELNFGDGTPLEITRATSVEHTYRTAGAYVVTNTFTWGGSLGWGSTSAQAVVGAYYNPVTPTRILDTRTGTGTGTVAPVAAGGTLTLPISSIGGVPAADISAVVMNVTVTKPTRSGNLTVFPGSGTVPLVSNLNFSAGETVPNLVTVQLSGGEVSFHNNSGGTVHVVADLEGFYGTGGYGYKPLAPYRVLDTRSGYGFRDPSGAGPVAAGGVLRLRLSALVPSGTAAVVLNLTVTQPKQGGYLTAYPDGVAKPNASNVNFSAGETVPNLVIVPLAADGVVDIANTSGGTAQMVADLAGYFAVGAPDAFVPYGPTRVVDTRTTHSPLAPHGTDTIDILSYTSCGACADAVADNVTVTAPTRNGNLIVYPAGSQLPVVSNLNFSARETVPNLAMVQGGNGKVSVYNQSGGQLQLIVDEYGYFVAASS